MIDSMEKIKTIARYNDAYEVLENFCGMEFWGEIDPDDDCFLRHFDDFEGMTYYCINEETFFVVESGWDVIAYFPSFEAFLRNIEDLLASDREER